MKKLSLLLLILGGFFAPVYILAQPSGGGGYPTLSQLRAGILPVNLTLSNSSFILPGTSTGNDIWGTFIYGGGAGLISTGAEIYAYGSNYVGSTDGVTAAGSASIRSSSNSTSSVQLCKAHITEATVDIYQLHTDSLSPYHNASNLVIYGADTSSNPTIPASGGVILNDRLQVGAVSSLTSDPGSGGIAFSGNLTTSGNQTLTVANAKAFTATVNGTTVLCLGISDGGSVSSKNWGLGAFGLSGSLSDYGILQDVNDLYFSASALAHFYIGGTQKFQVTSNGARVLTGLMSAPGFNTTTASSSASGGSGTWTPAVLSVGGSGQPTSGTQACWIPMTIDGVTTYVAGYR